jgi:hypothetical protein
MIALAILMVLAVKAVKFSVVTASLTLLGMWPIVIAAIGIAVVVFLFRKK